eukprot:TRINITY_DN1739_c0_g1_i2.p1 TRINITY_DN1739_c0_g1~~TRINITY_DN1739_c0_g1_i2.p1  ORF type:complete len:385 (-),score=146.05 TRINITY_DN1739_c0_g1_i2:108-1262(-)
MLHLLLRHTDRIESDDVHFWNVLLLFVQNGGDPNAQNDKGQTCLHVAITTGKDDNVIEELLKIGCDVNICDANGDSPTSLAIKHWRSTLLDLLQNNKEIRIINPVSEEDVNEEKGVNNIESRFNKFESTSGTSPGERKDSFLGTDLLVTEAFEPPPSSNDKTKANQIDDEDREAIVLLVKNINNTPSSPRNNTNAAATETDFSEANLSRQNSSENLDFTNDESNLNNNNNHDQILNESSNNLNASSNNNNSNEKPNSEGTKRKATIGGLFNKDKLTVEKCLESAPTMVGNMKKLGEVRKSWKGKYVVLDKNVLMVFGSSNGKEKVGEVIELEKCRVMAVEGVKKENWCIVVSHKENKKNWFFSLENNDLRMAWLQLLMRASGGK